jgi:hypothetical protein
MTKREGGFRFSRDDKGGEGKISLPVYEFQSPNHMNLEIRVNVDILP